MVSSEKLKIAILDLNEGFPNQGMRCIREIVQSWSKFQHCPVAVEEFEVRLKNQIPDLSFDIYISSGGPGSPLESQGSLWEENYFSWIETINQWNNDPNNELKKHAFFICHSFQLACRYFGVANVCKRKSTSFGVFPIHMLDHVVEEQIFEGLQDPFYGVDSRDFQAIQPNHKRIDEIGGRILAIEKERHHVPYERALMAIRFNDYFIGTQFHPEADAEGMTMYLQRDDKKETVIANHGFDKWQNMIDQLNDPDKILFTNRHIIPNFLSVAATHSGKC